MKTLYDNLLRREQVKMLLTDAVPEDVLIGWSCRVFTLMNIAWGYVDAVCDICISMGQHKTKKLVRAVRQVRKDYDRFRSKSVDADMERGETDRGEAFEDACSADFDKLFHGLQTEINKLRLDPDQHMLVLGVQQALTVMDAVMEYAGKIDSRLRRDYGFYAPDYCVVPSDFRRLYHLVPQFAGDCYRPGEEARKLTAAILANRMDEVEIRDGEGNMVDPGKR